MKWRIDFTCLVDEDFMDVRTLRGYHDGTIFLDDSGFMGGDFGDIGA